MADKLLPDLLFRTIAHFVPEALHEHILVVGSLAAAYYHREQLTDRGVNTKDADIVIQPAGAISESRAVAEGLLAHGWQRHEKCFAKPVPEHPLQAIRLWPPESRAFFFELLAFPPAEQTESLQWLPVQLNDGWYGLPSFRFLGLTNFGKATSEHGIRYAVPAMMALANLLSHRRVGPELMSEAIGGRTLRRSAKDLGRVLALAWLAGRDETEAWSVSWRTALLARFPEEANELAAGAGDGLRQLLGDSSSLDEAHHAANIGLLAGKGLLPDQLRAVGLQLLADALEPLARDLQPARG